MYELDEVEYQCPECERSHPWRAESAGRPVNCACGVVLTVPFSPGMAEAREHQNNARTAGEEPESGVVDDDERDEEESDGDEPVEMLLCPECGAPRREGAIVCPHCGLRRPKPKKRVFRRRAEAERLKPVEAHLTALTVRPFRDRTLPLVLTAMGLVVEVGLLAHFLERWPAAIRLTPVVALAAAVTLAAVFPITVFLTPVLDLSLGPILPLCIKLAAGVVFPPAVGVLLWMLCGRKGTGAVIGTFGCLLLYLSLFRLLFEFDWPDSMLLIAFVTLAQTVIVLALMLPLTYASGPMAAVWPLYQEIAVQSTLVFLLAGGVVAPHFGR